MVCLFSTTQLAFLRQRTSFNSVSRDDFTPTNLAPDNNTKALDPSKDVVETKQGVENVAEYIISEVSKW